MVDTQGNATTYTGGTTSRPIPIHDPTQRHTPQPAALRKPTGLDWDAHTPTCKICHQRSGKVDGTGLCPPCRGVALGNTTQPTQTNAPYAVLSEHQLAERFTAPTTAPPTLTETLDELERTDPKVAEAAAAYDAMVDHITAPVRVDAAALQVEEEAPIIRAKVTQTSPNDLVITLRGTGIATRTIEVAALLNDLLGALNHDTAQTPAAAAPAARKPLDRQPATAGTNVAPRTGKGKPARGATTTNSQRGRVGGKGGSTGKLTGHDQVIIDRYQAGESTNAIAADYDCTGSAIRYLLRRNGIALRAPGTTQTGTPRPNSRALTPGQEQAVVTEYAAGGISMQNLATDYGCSENAIRSTLHRAGVTIRKPSTRISTTTTSTGAQPA